LLAASRTSCAPIFSNLSESSISRATVTRHLDRVGQDVDAAQHAAAGIVAEANVFCGHG
jgi:hypothetical protein